MVSSTLNPNSITKTSSVSLESFGSFMLGENYQKSLDISNAANKIVNFNRSGVAPITPNISSLISNISTNILNQTNNSIKNVTNFLKDNLEARVNQLQKDLYSKILELQSNINQLQKDTRKVSSDVQNQLVTQIQVQTQEINQLKLEINQLKPQLQSQSRIQNKVEIIRTQTERTELQTEIQSQIEKELKSSIIQTEVNELRTEVQSQIQSEISRLNVELNSLRTELQTQIETSTTNLNSIQQIQNELSQVVQNQTSISNFNSLGQIQPIVGSSTIQNQTSVTEFTSVVENIQNQVENVLDTTIRNFSRDYQEKIKGVDDTRPNNVLSKFLDLYRNSVGFITFFGDRKNIKSVETNLKALRKIFEESFEVATLVRQTIIKIVNQLSNLPTASPSSGGLNLDIEVPGGRLRQAGGPRIRNIARMGGIAGAGLLGLGGAAAAMTGMGKAREYQESLLSGGGVSAASQEQYIPDNIVESFSGIVDRFTNAVNELISGAKRSAGVGGGREGGGRGGTSDGRGTPSPSGMSSSATQGTPQQKALLDAIAFAEGTQKSYGTIFGGKVVPELESGQLTVKQVYDMMMSGMLNGKPVGYSSGSRATGRYQFMPDTLSDIVRSGAIKWEDKFTNELQDRAILSRIASFRGVTPELLSKEGLSANVSNLLAPEFASFPTLSGRSYYGQSVKSLADIQRIYSQSLNSPQPTTQQTRPLQQTATAPTPSQQPRVAPAPIPAQTIQARSQAISQPAQQVPQTISLPPTVIDATGGQSQASSAPSTPATIPSPPPGPGPEVPFLPTTNPDNFLTMYSRMVYNIVDG